MSFQNPWAWLGALALALPIAVHLFSKRPARTIAFPSLRFVRVARVLPTHRTQLSDLLLLALRLAVVAAAVMALAQPLFRSAASANIVSRAIVLDTTSLSRDSALRAVARDSAQQLANGAGSGLVIETASPRDALLGATAWLSTHAGSSELFVLSEFRGAKVDSINIARIPRNVSVHLVRLPASRAANSMAGSVAANSGAANSGSTYSPADATSDARVRWATRAMPDAQDNLLRAVRAMGGRAVAVDASIAARPVAARPVAREIVVASADADSLSMWMQSAHTLASPWMGDAVVQMRRDTMLVSGTAEAVARDTTIAAPFTTVAQNNDGVPLVAAAAIDSGAHARLLIVVRAAASPLLVAATLLSASRAIAPTRVPADTSTITDAQLAALAQTPRDTAALSKVANASTRVADYETGDSHARFVWMLVLVLLAVEFVVRRQSVTAPPSASAAP